MDTNRWELASPSGPGPGSEAAGCGDAPMPVAPIERRMQLRAYNMWAGMIGQRRFPAVADLCHGVMGPFAPHCVLLDFTGNASAPAVAYLGERLARECGVDPEALRSLEETAAGTLLGRLVGLYPQVLAVAAPTGFEAELANASGLPMAYRGILLPYSTDDRQVDFVLAVINWKQLADEETSRQIIHELGSDWLARRANPHGAMVGGWADGPYSTCAETGIGANPGCGTSSSHAPPPPGASVADEAIIPPAIAQRLRTLPAQHLASAMESGEAEFALLLVRKCGGGGSAIVGQVPHDPTLLTTAAERLLG